MSASLFTLGQSLAAFRHYQELIGACDREIAQLLETFESKMDPPEGSLLESQDGQNRSGGEPRFDRQSHLYRIFGVDLTRIPGINVLTTQTLLAEIGPDLSQFPSAPEFTLGSDSGSTFTQPEHFASVCQLDIPALCSRTCPAEACSSTATDT